MTSPIVVFDSGFGGISVLKKLAALMPNERYLYFGDSAHVPYGTRDRDTIVRLTTDAIRPLLAEKPKMIVIACNTATAAAIEQVRALDPSVPVIGIRPAVLQAAAAGSRRILVLATASTLASKTYAEQLTQLPPQAEVISIPAPGIITYVEDGLCDRERVILRLKESFTSLLERPVDAVVLGCTHFPFARDVIGKALGYDVRFFDAADDIAVEVKKTLAERHTLASADLHGSFEFRYSLQTPQILATSKALFDMPL